MADVNLLGIVNEGEALGVVGGAAASVPITDDQTAAEVDYTPSGDLVATDVQAAIDELEAEKLAEVGIADLTATGTPSATTFLRGDNTWATPSGGSSASMARAYRDASVQAIATAASNAVQLNAEAFDDSGYHDNATNNSRFTVPSGMAGRFMVDGQIEYASNATGERRAMIYVNGALVAIETDATSSSISGHRVQVSSGVLNLAVGDYVELFAYQTSGGSLNIQNGAAATWMSLVKLS